MTSTNPDVAASTGGMKLVDEITGHLDYSLILTYPVESAVSTLTRKFGITLHGNLAFREDRMVMYGFMLKGNLNEKDQGNYFQMSRSRDLGKALVTEIEFSDITLIEFIRRASRVPSLVIMKPVLSDGVFHLTMLFNHSALNEVSGLVGFISESESSSSISHLGKSTQLWEKMGEITEEFPLSYIEFDLKVDDGETRKTLGSEWIRLKKLNSPDDSPTYLYLCTETFKGSLPEWIKPVEGDSMLFESTENSRFILEKDSAALSSGVPTFLNFLRKSGNKATYGLVIGAAFVSEYIRILKQIMKHSPELDATILQIHEIRNAKR